MINKLFSRLIGRKPPPELAAAESEPVSQRKSKAQKLTLVPRVISRDQHSISRKDISAPALKVLYKLREAGFQSHLVGGAVRDLLLGGHPKDFDVATDATPEQVRGLFRNCRLIGRRFRLAHVMFGSEIIEVATFRGVADDGSGDRHVVDGLIVRDNVYGTIEEDAVRRDFTVNAMYYSIDDFAVRDFCGGFEDVSLRQMRLIGDPELRYREDPVRMLRAVRLAAKLDFTIEKNAAKRIIELGDLLDDASPARLFDELLKLLMAGHAVKSFDLLEQYDLLRHLLPLTAIAIQRAPLERQLVRTALANTDARILADKPVTPAFLIAALFWPAAEIEARKLIDDGADSAVAWVHATQKVIDIQSPRIALPRRFTVPMQEIWAMQSRMEQIQRKRVVFRVIMHPRFRAAFDFLELRATVDESLVELAHWWKEAQVISHDDLSRKIQGNTKPNKSSTSHRRVENMPSENVDMEVAASASAAPKKRRRRKRKPKSNAATENV